MFLFCLLLPNTPKNGGNLIHYLIFLIASQTTDIRGEANPSTDILNRIAKALEASPDFLMNGTMQDKSADAIEDEELLLQFRKIEKLPSEKKKIVKELLEAFIFKSDLQKQLQG